VAEEDKRECLECWCKDNLDKGSFFCCKDCPAEDGPAVDYYLEISVTYRCADFRLRKLSILVTGF
jgi:hypothetical protein